MDQEKDKGELSTNEETFDNDGPDASEDKKANVILTQIDQAALVRPYRPLSREWFKEKFDEMAKADWLSKEVIEEQYDDFRKKYAPAVLKTLSGKDLLEKMFCGKEYLCDDLERNYGVFGTPGTGRRGSYVYYLFYDNKEKVWKTTYTGVEKSDYHSLSGDNADMEAEKIGGIVRDALVKGAEIIDNWIKDGGNDYSDLASKLTSNTSSRNLQDFYSRGWVLKYYHMIFPDYITNFYSDDYIYPVLNCLGIKYKTTIHRIVHVGEINNQRKNYGMSSNVVFSRVMYEIFSSSYLFCVNLSGVEKLPDDWLNNGRCGIGYKYLGDLESIKGICKSNQDGGTGDVKSLLKAHFRSKELKQRVGDVKSLFSLSFVDSYNYFVVISENKILGIGKSKDEFIFESDSEYGNYCNVEWLDVPIGEFIPSGGDVHDNGGDFYRFSQTSNNIPYLLTLIYDINNNIKRGQSVNMPKSEQEISNKSDHDGAIFSSHNCILFGPPGTGKTYSTVTMALDIMGVKYNGYDDAKKEYDKLRTVDVAPDKEGGDGGESKGKKSPRIQFVTFHQSYGYEEFIEGIRPKTKNGVVEYETKPGVFKEFCDTARRYNDNKYVFIIDEINRGNISKIFGELITLIEENKREGASEAASAILPYSGKSFSVPANVYILGTMNTADRSITSIDTALRRRFCFKEMAPEPKLLKDIHVKSINFELMLKTMNERIEALYDRDHCIGHAYFMGLKDNSTMKKLADIFKNRIIPLLQEYFFDDYGKIRLVLGDNQKNEEDLQFIKMESKDIKELFGEDIDDVRNRETYSINEDALEKPDAYIKIYKETS